MSIQSAAVNIQLFWGWLILLGVFIVDATLTLLRRAFNGEQFASAHRSHAYQHATQFYGSHLKVVLTVLAINFFWLLPLAFIAAMGYLDGFIALLIAYAPLIFIAFKLNAGKSSTFPMVENAVNKSI